MLDSHWLESFVPVDALHAMRFKAWIRFQEIGLPRPKQEAFQYFPHQALVIPEPAQKAQIEYPPVQDLHFVDGFYEELQSPLADSVICLPLEKALRTYGLLLQSRFAKTAKEESDPFALLNGALHGRGAFLYVPPKCKAVLHVMHTLTSDKMASPRLHIYLGRGASLKLHQESRGASGLCNALLDVSLDEGAALVLEDMAQGHLQTVRAHLKRDSHFKALFLGEALRRSIKVQLTEENGAAELLGLARLQGSQEAHIHATIEHIAPHTRSRQHFKTVVQDQGRYSFEGKILIHSEAQKTESYQLSNALLLSDTAVVNTKPNLEIFADDVKASHGATVGQLDEESLFYLRSRGLSYIQARQWLIEGFCKEILDHAR